MTMLEVRRLTLADYEVMMQAKALEGVDNRFHLALQAWYSTQVQATKKRGKGYEPVYRSFGAFFDYEKELSKAWGKVAQEEGYVKGLIEKTRMANAEERG